MQERFNEKKENDTDGHDYLRTEALVSAIITLFASHQIKYECALTSLTFVMAQIIAEMSRDEEDLRSALFVANRTLTNAVNVIVEKMKKNNKDLQST